MEYELKFAVSAEDGRRLAGLPLLRRHGCGETRRERLVSVYYDTPDRELQRRGLSLRVRHVGRTRLQTVKSGSGAIARGEWEEEIEGDRPRRDLARQTALAPLATRGIWGRLKPVFTTDVERTIVPLRAGDSRIELAIDRGRIRAGRRSLAVSEIELELQEGEESDVVMMAKELAQEVPLSFAVSSKPERGYALSAGGPRPAKAEALDLGGGLSVGEAFKAIGLSCLRQVAANRALLDDGEGLHQMRVGLRRLRAAISIFKAVLEPRQTGMVKRELKWLTEELAPARDLDVFLNETVLPLEAEQPKLGALRNDFERRRAAAFARARQAADCERYRRLMLGTLFWLLMGERRPCAACPLKPFAKHQLRRRTRKIVKRARKLERLDARRRHKLRIAAKKLRYATQFFAGVKPRRKRFLKALKALQGALGKLNDFTVHQRLTGEVSGRDENFAIGLVRGIERSRAPVCLARAAKAVKALR